MMRGPRIDCALLALMAILAVTPAGAWDRGRTETFAVVPYLPGKVPVSIEGLTVGPDGTVYAPSFGFNSDGEVTATPHLFSFWPNGNLRKDVALVNPNGPPQPSPLAERHCATLGRSYGEANGVFHPRPLGRAGPKNLL
jgi:hypothetical protein